ncbi:MULTISPECIES: hypothetical protein [unclassified Variovorax]|uniref:hypothetical protein n=1 Tax=unclassified Variovorax TaxID=663243 RepID=UPI003F46D29F
MTEQSSCYSLRCGLVTSEAVDRCPQCGGRMRSASQVRRLGWVLVVLGVLLAAGMGAIAYALAPSMLSPGVADAQGARFTGTAMQGRTVLGLFGVVILFGFLCIANGAWQIVKGQRSKWLAIATLVMVALIVLSTWRTISVLPG